MRILVISNLYPPDVMGGYEVCCEQMVRALRQRGHELRVLTTASRLPMGAGDPGYVARRLKLVDIWSTYGYQNSRPIVAHLNQNESHRISAHNVRLLLDELAAVRPDVVFLHMILGIGAMGILGTLSHQGVPWVWQLGDDVPVKMCRLGDGLVPEFVRAFGRLEGGRFIAVSQQLLDAIGGSGVSLPGPVTVIPNGVPGPFPPRHRFYEPGDPLRLVHAAGVLDPGIDKGTNLAIDCVALLRDRGIEATLDIFGLEKGPAFAQQIAARDLTDRVRLGGFLPATELVGRYVDYDLFLFPTRPGEPFGMAPLEAAARGCVPLISEVCGVAEWLVDGAHLLKAPRHVEAFADVLERVHEGSINLARLARRSAPVVREFFSIDSLIGSTESVLRAAAESRRRPGAHPDETYRLAVLAEKLSRSIIQTSQIDLVRTSA